MPKVLFLYPNLQLMQIIPAGITSLAAYLKQRGVEVDIFDTTLYKVNEKSSDEERVDNCQVRPFKFADSGVKYKNTDIVEDFYVKIEEFKPDVLAISCNDFTHNIAEKLIAGIKKQYPNINIIMGGIYPTFFPNEAIAVPDVDAICIGEGYEALYEFVMDTPLADILNLWFKPPYSVRSGLDSDWNKRVFTNPLRPPIDIEKIPFDDLTIFEEKRFYRPMHGKMLKMVPMWLDLGCPYHCAYCTAPRIRQMYRDGHHNYLRTKSVDHIMKELHHQVDLHKPDYIYFSTETFFARPENHIEEFAQRYAKEFKIPFWCETRVENITDKRVMLLKEMGCDRLSLGLESGNEAYRINVLNKTFTNQQFYDAIKILQKHRIKLTVNNIIGFPDETREMIFETIFMNKTILEKSPVDISLTVSTFVPCGGSGLQQYCIEKGYFDLKEYLAMPSGSFHKGAFLKMPQITQDEVKGLLRTFPLYTRLPYQMTRDIEKAEKLTPEGDEIFKKLRDIYWKNYF